MDDIGRHAKRPSRLSFLVYRYVRHHDLFRSLRHPSPNKHHASSIMGESCPSLPNFPPAGLQAMARTVTKCLDEKAEEQIE